MHDAQDSTQELRNGHHENSGVPPSSLELSMAKVRAKAKSLEKGRTLNPNRYSKTKSKVGKNIKVIDKTASTTYLNQIKKALHISHSRDVERLRSIS